MKKLYLVLLLVCLAALPAQALPPFFGEPDASATQTGLIRHCSNADALAGTDTACAMTADDVTKRLDATTGPGITITTAISADAALSGTPVIITIYDKDTGTPYYFKAYPTKQ